MACCSNVEVPRVQAVGLLCYAQKNLETVAAESELVMVALGKMNEAVAGQLFAHLQSFEIGATADVPQNPSRTAGSHHSVDKCRTPAHAVAGVRREVEDK